MIIRAIVLLLLFVPVARCFSPCAPPRFDVFCDKIVGSWQTPDGTQSVEEVMRSCGGAVQGIRDDFYLNRADDGFVYFDCGTYSHGPVDTAATNTFMASLAVPKARILLSSSEGKTEATLAPKATFGGESTPRRDDLSLKVIKKPEYNVWRQIQCRMSSPSQPWMMQRVQWESSEGPDEGTQPQGPYQCWVEQKESLIFMGISCIETGYFKEIVRSCGENGKLTRVALQEGKLL